MRGQYPPATPLPLTPPPKYHGRPEVTLAEHVRDFSDPHNTRALVPDLRIGSGVPSVEPGDKERDAYLDTDTKVLYILCRRGTDLEWVAVVSASGEVVVEYSSVVGKPSINGVELDGEKTSADLGLAAAGDVPTAEEKASWDGKQDAIAGLTQNLVAWISAFRGSDVGTTLEEILASPPLAHAASHGVGGSDAVTVAQSQVEGLGEALAAKRGKADFAVYGKAWEYKNGGTVVDNIMAEWGDPYGTGLGWRFLLDGGSPFPDAPISTDKDAEHLAYGSYTADKVDAQVDSIAKTSEVAEALKSRRGLMDLTVYGADYPTEGQVWTWTNPNTGEKVSKSLNFRTLHYEDVYGPETYDFTGWIDADGESMYPGQPYVRVSAGIGATSGEVQVVHHGDEPDEEYTAVATRAAPDVDPHPTEDTLAKNSVVNERIAKKADEDGGWTNDVDNDRYTVVFEDPYGWGYSQWWLYENGSRREYAGSMGDESSETLTWHAFSEWDADFDITFTRRLVLRRGDPDLVTRKDLAGKRGINDFDVFGEWECDSSDFEVRWNGDGWGLWFSPGGFWISTVNKGDEKSVSLSWSLDNFEIQFGPETVTATREAGTLAQSSYVDSKADEFGEWTTDYSGSGEAPRVIWAKQGGLYGWWLFLHGSIESTYVGGEIDAVEMHWEPGDWSGGVSLTATRPRVLRVTGTGSVVKHDANGYYVEV